MMRARRSRARKRHILTDTLGLMLVVLVHAADIQDRDAAPHVLKAIRYRFPFLRHIFADGGYAGQKFLASMEGNGTWTIQIIKRSDTAKDFEVLPRRWVVERTFAWLGRCRRLANQILWFWSMINSCGHQTLDNIFCRRSTREDTLAVSQPNLPDHGYFGTPNHHRSIDPGYRLTYSF